MAEALQKHCGEVHRIGPITSFEKDIIGRFTNKSAQLLLKKRVAYDRLSIVAKKHARIIQKLLVRQRYDFIFAPVGASEIAFLETTTPIILVEDGTFAQLHNYYPGYSRLLSWSARQGHAIEMAAYQNAHALLYCSTWAARSALYDYHADYHKVHIIPFGANLDTIPSRETVFNRQKSSRCTLIFIGIGWEKKGGDIAFETLIALENMGIDTDLIICGSIPPASISHPNMTVIPFLDKNDDHQRHELEMLYQKADFLIVPSRQEAFGIVFCEASAYGIPSLTASTGGTSDAVYNGKNGFILPYDARGQAYAEIIAEIYGDDSRYSQLVKSSRRVFEDLLNWNHWGTSVQQLLLQILSQP